MPPRSKLKVSLARSPEARARLHQMIDEGREFRDMADAMRELGVDTSKSALHRYAQSEYEPLARAIRWSREMATAVVDDLGADTGDSLRLLVESLTAACLELRLKMEGDDELDLKVIKQLVGMGRDLGLAFKSTVDSQLQIRRQVAKDAAEAAGEVAQAQGLSATTVDAIKAAILGIAERS